MMFRVVIPVMNQHEATYNFMTSWFDNAKSRLHVSFIDNASDDPLEDQEFIEEWRQLNDIVVIRNDENIGVYPTFQQGLKGPASTFIFYSHNDVEMLEQGWDLQLRNVLEELCYAANPGVCGMFGALGIGTPDIYKAPYKFTQMMRRECYTVPAMADAHSSSSFTGRYKRIMVLDGFSLIVRTKMVREVMHGRFPYEDYPAHHMYDSDICLESHFGGFENYALNIDCRHHGGITSTREKWAEKMESSDHDIHRKAHEVFYQKYQGRLPAFV